MKEHITVAIDGPSGAGKSTIARAAAARFGLLYVDTGAAYRTVAYALRERGVPAGDENAVAAALPDIHIRMAYDKTGVQRMYLNDTDVSDRIRTLEISRLTSEISAQPRVRAFLLEMQRSLAATQSVIMDGRDIGTVVLPDAGLKLYLFASAECRAERRWKELRGKGHDVALSEVLRDIEARDAHDMHRAEAPLRRAEDAVPVDTTALTLEESIEAVCAEIRRRFSDGGTE